MGCLLKLIFLDVDGVLNQHQYDLVAESNHIDADKVLILNRILVATGAKIVLSSAWRYHIFRHEMNLDGLNWLFRSHGLKSDSIVDITHQDTPTRWECGNPVEFVENERALQVIRYREHSGHVGPFVVIDDMDLGFTTAGLPWVETVGTIGLRDRDADLTIKMLND